MTWIIASLPFWAIGGFFVWAGVGCALGYGRRRHETAANLSRQLLFGLLVGGIFLLIAAKISS